MRRQGAGDDPTGADLLAQDRRGAGLHEFGERPYVLHQIIAKVAQRERVARRARAQVAVWAIPNQRAEPRPLLVRRRLPAPLQMVSRARYDLKKAQRLRIHLAEAEAL